MRETKPEDPPCRYCGATRSSVLMANMACAMGARMHPKPSYCGKAKGRKKRHDFTPVSPSGATHE